MLNEIQVDEHLCRLIEDSQETECCRCRAVKNRLTELCSWCLIEEQYEKNVYINAFNEIEYQLKKEHNARTKKELFDHYNLRLENMMSRKRYTPE